MLKKITEHFERIYKSTPVVYSSPGRVNLIGEHTDYNEGFVLPGAVDKKIYVALKPNGTRQVNVYAAAFDKTDSFSLDDLKPQKGWESYLIGVTHYLIERGCPVAGVDVVVDGDIPVGAGMSSSAALCCAFGFALSDLFGCEVSRLDLALIGQKTEHNFAGVKVGIMDQFASLHGKAGHVIRLDCRSMEYEYIPFTFPEYRIVLVNSMVSHSLASSEYNVRRQQCEEGVRVVRNKLGPEIKSLRDVDMKELEACRSELGEETFRRCSYVIEENERLLKACEALEERDIRRFGSYMYGSHEGLSKKYNVSCEELDFLVEQARPRPEVAGSRMMGGGFGGCTINLVEAAQTGRFVEEVQAAYRQRYGKTPEAYVTQIEEGTRKEG